MSWILVVLIALVSTYIFLLALYVTIKKAIVAAHHEIGIAAARDAANAGE
jgi:hypothetical protein